MFPFDLPGPQFLVFYGALFVAAMVFLYVRRQVAESHSAPPVAPSDPYLISCLRSGPMAVVTDATVGLIDRGVLTIAGRRVTQAPSAERELLSRPIERAVFSFFAGTADLFDPTKNLSVLAAAAEHETELRRLGLIPDERMQEARRTSAYGAVGLLLAVGAIKLMVAASTGHFNMGFLIMMMIAAPFVARAVGFPYRTASGNQYLANMRTLFSRLRDQVKSVQPGTGAPEVLWSLALFGVSALPASAFPLVQYFRRDTTGDSGCGSASSCGGGDGGGGCGGGGCGGGCGGG